MYAMLCYVKQSEIIWNKSPQSYTQEKTVENTTPSAIDWSCLLVHHQQQEACTNICFVFLTVSLKIFGQKHIVSIYSILPLHFEHCRQQKKPNSIVSDVLTCPVLLQWVMMTDLNNADIFKMSFVKFQSPKDQEIGLRLKDTGIPL